MKRGMMIRSALVLAGLVAMALMAVPSALATDQPMDKVIGPQMESGKDITNQRSSMQPAEPTTGELSKEMEKPMKAPDAGTSEESRPGYRPLCGPSKDAINHYACGEGYQQLAF